jgi:hypothetical protein
MGVEPSQSMCHGVSQRQCCGRSLKVLLEGWWSVSSKWEALSSNPSTTKHKNKTKQNKKTHKYLLSPMGSSWDSHDPS